MNTFVGVFLLGTLAAANAGIVPFVNQASIFAPVVQLQQYAPEGQYIPDHIEKLYDDGSYKPLARLRTSPYGLVPEGSGLEGEYVPDLTEKFYDDGSYKPEIQLARLAVSPYGLVPAGSGLEGQYVHDHSEKLYDDGSYKPEAKLVLAKYLY